MKNVLQIADQNFELNSAEFFGHLTIGQNGWHVWWSFEFEGKEKEVNEIAWEPVLSSHDLSLKLPDFPKLPTGEVPLDDSADGEAPFILYTFEHEPLRQGQIRFGKWIDNKVEIFITGVADVNADDQYAEDLPVQLEYLVPFGGISVDESKLEKAQEKFDQFFNSSLFMPPERQEYSCLFRLRG